jgi:transitional endoplasmic reticulum ATPase
MKSIPGMPPEIRAVIEQVAAEAAGKTLNDVPQAVNVAEVVHHGDKLILPENLDIQGAIDLLERRAEYLDQDFEFSEKFDAFPWDGAAALQRALIKLYGWAPAVSTPSFFGPQAPKLHNIEVAPGVFEKVPWGRFSLPNVSGHVDTQVTKKANRTMFSLNASVLRKDEGTITKLFNAVREELRTGSIYRGKAIKIRFRDDNGGVVAMPEPSFIDTNVINPVLIYTQAVKAALETNLFTPITRIHDLVLNGMRAKRGVLLGGVFGTGKTLAATVAAKLAVEVGVTYIYVPRADELADAIEFAKQYQNPAAVVFVEDIDRSLDGERTEEMDDILNIIDGIDTKTANIITVLTTNALENINPAMLRPGRLDAVINITPPDAAAAEELVRAYGGDAIRRDTDLSAVAKALDGVIPAVIAEVVHRAKLVQLKWEQPGRKIGSISAEALLEAAETMQMQIALLAPKKAAELPTLDKVFRSVVQDVVDNASETGENVVDTEEAIGKVHRNLTRLNDRFDVAAEA